MQPITNLRQKLRQESSEDPNLFSGKKLQWIIGVLGMIFPAILIIGAKILGNCGWVQETISAYYHTVMRDAFVGILSAIALAFMVYRGHHKYDYYLTNVAALLTLGVAFFPTSVTNKDLGCHIDFNIAYAGVCSFVHAASALLLFVLLAFISRYIFTLSRDEMRNRVYRYCGMIMFICVLLILVYQLIKGDYPSLDLWEPVFILETIALIAFGFSWLTKGGLLKS